MMMLRRTEVCRLTGLSASTLDRLERAGQFPARRRIGRSAVAWIDTEVNAWIAGTPIAGPTAAAPAGAACSQGDLQ